MIVLGGLIEDRLTESESRVPVLGKIPVIGALFRVRNTQKTKTNLMVFIRPRVLRTAEQAAIETNSKYNYLRDLQLNRNDGNVRMIPGAQQPTLPPLVGPTQPTRLPPPPSSLESFSPVTPAPPPEQPPVPPGNATTPPPPASEQETPPQ
jgi:general secretion pathway protein D